MNSRIDAEIKKQIKYDKLNTKYNRLWEQSTNFFLFFFATLAAYSTLFVQYRLDGQAAIFISKAILPLIAIIAIPIIAWAILLGFMFAVRTELQRFLNKYDIMG